MLRQVPQRKERMKMQRLLSLAGVCTLVLFLATPTYSYIAVPKEPIANKIAQADCVVVGKITAIDPKPVFARLYRHIDAKMGFVVADVEVSKHLLGPKAAKKVRLAFLQFQVKSGEHKPAPAVGQEGCFYAVKHCTEDFHVVPAGGFHPKKAKEFEKELALTRRCCKLLSEPNKALKAKELQDRVLTAYLLVLRYTYGPIRLRGKYQAKPIDAEQSKLIMLALAEADWGRPAEKTEVSPRYAVDLLDEAARQGGVPMPKSFPANTGDKKKDAAARKQWLKDNAESYRIQRLVPVMPLKK
jgi:hypothetical protein